MVVSDVFLNIVQRVIWTIFMIFLHNCFNLKASVPIHWNHLEKYDWHIFLNIFVCGWVCVTAKFGDK